MTTTLSYPFEITPSGNVAEVSGVRAALQQAKLVLATTLGSRAMRPTFGSRLPTQVFDSLDVDTDDIREDVRRAVTDAVAGVIVNDVRVQTDIDAATLEVTVLLSMEQEVSPRIFEVSLEFGRVIEDRTP